MDSDNIDNLVTRVANGFLFFATEKQIRDQLLSEGISETMIDAAISRGKKAACTQLCMQPSG